MHAERNMKRPRNVDCGKLRRPMKRGKITDGIYGSTFLYVRFLLVWALVLMADFILEFRFEYLWPFWLLLRSVYDSFKYQGLAFSVFFVCIAITSDVVCYLFIPIQWLFFAASTYVWVQYVWHTERGICLPTVSLWLLFVYIEASVRLRELKSLPFNLDLCRPFAAHCIGYPVVTLGFGFKSYISYRLRLVCAASQQHSLAGLDNIAAEGSEAFTTLFDLVDAMGELGMSCFWVDQMKLQLQNVKHYMKTDYKLDVQLSSNCPDHCMTYALSQKDICTHAHDVACEHCVELEKVFSDIDEALRNDDVIFRYDNHKDEMLYDYKSAQENIERLKSHLLRKKNQERAKADILDNLTANQTHITMDWAMKFLPQKFRESQQDWFGKKGVSWHITAAVTKVDNGEFQRRQKVVQKENDFYTQLLSQSLPLELQYNAGKQKALTPKLEEEIIPNGVAGKKVKVEEDKEKEREKDNKKQTKSVDINEADEVEFIEKSWQKKSNVNQFDENVDSSEQQTKSFKTSGVAKSAANKLNSSKENSANKKSKNYSKDLSPASFTNNKDEVILRLENDIKKVKNELQSSRNQEQELRSQINNLVSGEKSQHSEIYQLQQDNDNLQNKLHNLVTSRQQDKQNIAILEKKLIEERKLRTSFEQQLAAERKAKKVEDAAAARAVAMTAASRNECTESCKARRRESENDVKLLRRDLKLREDQYRNLDVEIQTLRQIKDNQKENVLMAALGAMQEKNTELENSLTAETRFKQELFSALAEERRQIKVLQISVSEREAVIVELKSKIAEVMALIPSTTTYQPLNSERTSSPLFSAKLCQEQFPAPVTISNLNPNASDYTPKMAI